MKRGQKTGREKAGRSARGGVSEADILSSVPGTGIQVMKDRGSGKVHLVAKDIIAKGSARIYTDWSGVRLGRGGAGDTHILEHHGTKLSEVYRER